MFELNDDYDFTPSTSSNLASLFGASMSIPDDANKSLTYTAPKQPRPDDSVRDVSNKSTVQDSKQQSRVLCAKVVNLYKLENGEYTSLGRHGLALIQSPTPESQVLIIYKEKNNIITRVKINNNFNFSNHNDSFSSFFDNSDQTWLIRFETVPDRTFISQEIEKLGGSLSCDTPNTSSEGAVKKENKDKETAKASTSQSTKTEEKTVDSDSSDNRVKADILSRMAKMGQSILPAVFSPSQSTDLSDSDTCDAKQSPKIHKKPRKPPVAKAREVKTATVINNDEASLVTRPSDIQLSKPFYSEGTVIPQNATLQTTSREQWEQYLVDNRARDTDLRLNLCDISAKLEYLVRQVNLPNNVSSHYDKSNEESLLLAKVKALELRSENLTAELQNLNSNYAKLLEEYEVISNTCKSIKEERASSSEAVVTELKKKIVDLETELDAKKVIIHGNNITIDNYKQEIEILISLIETCNTKKAEEYKEMYDNNEALQKQIKDLNATISNMKENIEVLDSSVAKLEENKQKMLEECHTKQNNFSEDLMTLMNVMYENIIGSFTEKDEVPASEIQSIVARNIKETTYKILKNKVSFDFAKSDN